MRIGPYSVERELGRGGMGTVYLARAGHEAPVAVKVIHASLAADPQVRARFEAEGEALERLSHPNLVSLRGRGMSAGGLWLAMDFVPGQTLAERLKTAGPLSSPAAGELLLSLCAGLASAHALGVLHRDLKPSNILLQQEDERPLVLDFGLALPLDVSQHLTRTGEILGSPGYLAPEQCGSKDPTSVATDVYGLGAVLYAALTGRPPLQGSSLVGTLDAVLNRAPKDPQEWIPSIDPSLAKVCLRCLAKDPSERFASVEELAQALRDEPAKPGRRSWLGAGLAGLALGGLLAGAYLAAGEPPGQQSSQASPVTPSPSEPAVDRDRLPEARAAVSAGDWGAAHRALKDERSTEGTWLGYLALVGEIRAKGEACEEWHGWRSAALARAQALEEVAEPWPVALCAMLEATRYPFTVDVSPSAETKSLAERIRPACQLETLSADQRREVARSLAQVELLRLKAGGGQGVIQGVEEAVDRWARLGGDPCLVQLGRAVVASARQRWNEVARALDRAERDAGEDHPWRLAMAYFVREALVVPSGEIPPPAQLSLSQTLLATPHLPTLLRARAATRYARSLVEAGRSKEALEVLATHQVPARFPVLAAAHLEAQAHALLRGGQPGAARDLLLGAAQLRSPWGRGLLAISHLQAGESDLGRSALRGLARKLTTPEGQLLLLEATALAGDSPRWRALLEALTKDQDLVGDLRVQSALERALEVRTPIGKERAPNPGPLRAEVAALRVRVRAAPELLVEQLLAEGRWRRALRWIQEELGEGAIKPQPQLATRLSYRALERGREEEDEPSADWRKLRRLATHFAERTLGDSQADRGLRALLELSGDPPPPRLKELESVLREALEVATWVELHEGHFRALTLRLVIENRSGLDQDELKAKAITAWVQAHPRDLNARHVQVQSVSWSDRQAVLTALSRQELDRAVAIQAERDRIFGEVGQERLEPHRGAEQLSTLALDRIVLRGQRRELLVRAVELWLMVPGYAREALTTLRRIEAWCGPTPPGQVDSFELARSRALAEIPGRIREALAAAQRALASIDEADPARARVLAYLGRIECELGQREGGLVHLRQALELAPGPEIWVEFARASSGAEQARAYVQVLGFPTPPGSANLLLAEIRDAGQDLAKICADAFRLLEARGQARAGLVLARAAQQLRPDASTGRLVCQAYLISSMMAPEALPSLSWFEPFVESARGLVEPAFLDLFDALLSLLRARTQPGGSPTREAEVEAALERVQAASKASPKDGVLLRLPLAELSAYQDLALTNSEREKQLRYRARAREVLEAWVGRPGADLRAPSWLARLQSEDGDYDLALTTLDQGLKASREFPAQTGGLELAKAVALSHLDRMPEALEALERSLRAGGPLAEGAPALSLRAEVQLRAGDIDAASQTLSRARASRAVLPPSIAVGLELVEARVLFARGRPEEARPKVERLRALFPKRRLGPRSRAQFFLLDARLRRLDGALAAARQLVNQALELTPKSEDALSADLDQLVAEGEEAAARQKAKDLAERGDLSPRARRALKERARQLSAGD